MDIDKTVETLRSGGVILYPTDTIWGLGCDATNEEAVAQIYAIKQRPDSKTMLVLVDNVERLRAYIEQLPPIATELIANAERPLTVIYPRAKNLPANLVSSDGTIGIRLTTDDFCCRLIAALGRPIVSTSANISGEPSPSVYSTVSAAIVSAADYVVQYRQTDNTPAQPSGIVKINDDNTVLVIRK